MISEEHREPYGEPEEEAIDQQRGCERVVCQVPEAVGRSFARVTCDPASTLEVRIKQLALNCNFSPLFRHPRRGAGSRRITEHASNISQRVKPARTLERILSRGFLGPRTAKRGKRDPPTFIGLL